ncbi:amino acid permease [Streptomyces sp. SID5785]|uniref:amino acid permease n=1 Tax=Streptomyces sp. SID5785 TaxID=2690309 RepID=UPI001F3138F2|nr:amino acid permease [Streptomyces sp. SID5785]
MIGLGSALGTGLFLGSGTAIGIAGPAVIVAYLIGATLIAVIAVALGEMTIAHPERGSFGAIAHRYLGPWAGFLTRWLYWMGVVVVVGSEVVASAVYLRWWWPDIPLLAAILAMAAIVVGVNLYSVKSFGVMEFWLSSLKVTAICVFLVCGALLVVFGLPGTEATGVHHLTDGSFLPHGVVSVWTAMSVVMFAFAGFETVAIAAAETTDPARSMRTSMRQLAWRLALFYVGSITLVITLSPWRQSAAGDGSVNSSPFVRLFAEIGIPAAASLTNAVVLVAAVSSANAGLYATSRLLHSLGHDRLAPRPVARVNRRGVPVAAMLASAAGIGAAALLAAYGVGDIFSALTSIAIFAILLTWLLILASYIAFKRRRPAGEGVPGTAAFRLPGGTGTAVIGVIGVLAVLATAVEVPDMRRAATVGSVFTLFLGLAYSITHLRQAPHALTADRECQEDGPPA